MCCNSFMELICRLVVEAISPPPLASHWRPLVVLANPKSGGKDGEMILSVFRRLLNPIQVGQCLHTHLAFLSNIFSQFCLPITFNPYPLERLSNISCSLQDIYITHSSLVGRGSTSIRMGGRVASLSWICFSVAAVGRPIRLQHFSRGWLHFSRTNLR